MTHHQLILTAICNIYEVVIITVSGWPSAWSIISPNSVLAPPADQVLTLYCHITNINSPVPFRRDSLFPSQCYIHITHTQPKPHRLACVCEHMGILIIDAQMSAVIVYCCSCSSNTTNSNDSYRYGLPDVDTFYSSLIVYL